MSTRPEQAAVLSDLAETWATPEPDDPVWCLELAAYLGQARCFAPTDPTVKAAAAWLTAHQAAGLAAWHEVARQDATLEGLSAAYDQLNPSPEEVLDHLLNVDALLAAAEALGQPALAAQLAGAVEDILTTGSPLTAQLAEAARRTLQWLRPEGARRALWQSILDAEAFESEPLTAAAAAPPWLDKVLERQPGPDYINLEAARALRSLGAPMAQVGLRAAANLEVTVAIPDATSLWRSPDGALELTLEREAEGDVIALYGEAGMPTLEVVEPPLGAAEVINAFTQRLRLPEGQPRLVLQIGAHRLTVRL